MLPVDHPNYRTTDSKAVSELTPRPEDSPDNGQEWVLQIHLVTVLLAFSQNFP